jgi:hypothetical protein
MSARPVAFDASLPISDVYAGSGAETSNAALETRKARPNVRVRSQFQR